MTTILRELPRESKRHQKDSIVNEPLTNLMSEPSPCLLRRFAGLRRGDSWSVLQPALKELQSTGYTAQELGDDGCLDAKEWPKQREVLLGQLDADGQEVGLAYLGFDSEGGLQSAALSWSLREALTVKDFERHTELLVRCLGAVLGKPRGILSGAPEGLSSNGDRDLVLAQAFWSYSSDPSVETSLYHGHNASRQYRDALAAVPDAATVWLVADAWRDGASMQAIFRPFVWS